MASRNQLLEEMHGLLQKCGFSTSDPKALIHAGFDIVAKQENLILVIKVAANASSINQEAVAGMTTLAKAVDGSPMIVAMKSGSEAIEGGVMYTRAGVPLLSPQSFYDLVVEGVPPLVYAAGGGYYVNLDSEALKGARSGGISLGELAEMAGVSRRTIQMYEEGMNPKLEIAIRLEERMGLELIVPANPLVKVRNDSAPFGEAEDEGLAREIFLKLHAIGYSVQKARNCPFDAVTQDSEVILFTGIGQRDSDLSRRARAISNLSEILEKHSVIFVDRRGEKINLAGTPIIGCKELNQTKSKEKLMRFIEERL